MYLLLIYIIKFVIECLRGENSKIFTLDAFTRISDQILAINFSRWVNALKWGYMLHICIYVLCIITIISLIAKYSWKLFATMGYLVESKIIRLFHKMMIYWNSFIAPCPWITSYTFRIDMKTYFTCKMLLMILIRRRRLKKVLLFTR